MSWNERRAFSRSSATIVWSVSSMGVLGPHGTQRFGLEMGPKGADHCPVTTSATQIPHATAPEVMPVHGIDHLEFYVGNAAQAAYFYTRAYAFTETAYRGLETGSRDRVSHVLEQGRIRLVLTGTLTGDDEIAEHHRRHGDGVRVIALSVPDAAAAYEYAVGHGARGLRTPWEESDDGG